MDRAAATKNFDSSPTNGKKGTVDLHGDSDGVLARCEHTEEQTLEAFNGVCVGHWATEFSSKR